MNQNEQFLIADHYGWMPWSVLTDEVRIVILDTVREIPEVSMQDVNLTDGTVFYKGERMAIPRAAYKHLKYSIDNP